MVTSLGLIIILGLFMNYIFEKMNLPGLLGMLILGIIIGPFGLNLLDKVLLDVSQDFRTMALIIILLRAGLGISREKLNSVGSTAIKFSCVPGICEGFVIAFVSTKLLGFSFIEGGILGFIIAAVIVTVMPLKGYASDYKGNEKQDSVFQKLGDFITGKYDINGQPLKKKGVIQVMADQVKDMQPVPVK